MAGARSGKRIVCLRLKRAQRVEQDLKIIRRRRLKPQRLAADRMRKAQHARMQRLPFEIADRFNRMIRDRLARFQP